MIGFAVEIKHPTSLLDWEDHQLFNGSGASRAAAYSAFATTARCRPGMRVRLISYDTDTKKTTVLCANTADGFEVKE